MAPLHERRDDAEVGVDDVVALLADDAQDLPARPRMDGQLVRQVDRDAVDGDAVDDLAVRAVVAGPGRGGDDLCVDPGRALPPRQPVHLRLDPAEAGQIAVGEVGDPHARTLRPRADQPGW
jgi:hypothetical protein